MLVSTEDTTRGWQNAAAPLSQAIDSSQDPCDDFYQFACGGWEKANPPRFPGMNNYNVRDLVQLDVDDEMVSYLNQVDLGANTTAESIKKAKLFFDWCRNSTMNDVANNTALLDLMNDFGGWPIVTENWDERKIQVAHLAAQMQRHYGMGNIFRSMTEVDPHSRAGGYNYVLFAFQAMPALGSPDLYLNARVFGKVKAAYLRLIRDIAEVLAHDQGIPPSKLQIEKEAREILDFETELARAIVRGGHHRNVTGWYNRMNITELANTYHNFDWEQYYRTLLDSPEFEVVRGSYVVVQEPTYMAKLNTLLGDPNDKVKIRQTVNYLMWRATLDLNLFLDPRTKDAISRFHEETGVVFEELKLNSPLARYLLPPSRYECVQLTREFFKFPVGRLYVQHHVQTYTDYMLNQEVLRLREAFNLTIHNASYLDDASKARAEEKLKKLRVQLGYPEWILNDTKLDEVYAGLNTDAYGPTFFEVFRTTTEWFFGNRYSLLRKQVDRDRWSMSPATVGAAYEPLLNLIIVPAAIIRAPFFNVEYPDVVNYGSMLSIVAHELIHAFDDIGVQFNGDGQLETWMTDVSKSNFSDVQRCVIDQYNGYCYPDLNGGAGMCINGLQTLGENLADLGAIHQVFRAWRLYETEKARQGIPPQPSLPGLEDYTPDESFFIAYAHNWCSVHKKDTMNGLETQLATVLHSPPRYRVNGPLRNFPRFSSGSGFRCPVNTFMQLPKERRCPVWANKDDLWL